MHDLRPDGRVQLTVRLSLRRLRQHPEPAMGHIRRRPGPRALPHAHLISACIRRPDPFAVIPGLDPGIHTAARRSRLREIPGSSPGMTERCRENRGDGWDIQGNATARGCVNPVRSGAGAAKEGAVKKPGATAAPSGTAKKAARRRGFRTTGTAPYRPTNTGLRFSTKALAASRWSSVRPEREWLRASMSSVSESEAVTAPFRVCFM